MAKSRHVYTPRTHGWIVTRDMLRNVLDAIDCSAGGAQEAYERRCVQLHAEGWTLEERFGDSRYASRGAERIEISIERDPATVDGPSYMSSARKERPTS